MAKCWLCVYDLEKCTFYQALIQVEFCKVVRFPGPINLIMHSRVCLILLMLLTDIMFKLKMFLQSETDYTCTCIRM